MDYFTKHVSTYAMPNQTAETVSECLLDMVLQHGVPERLHSDEGQQFESAVFQSLCSRLGIKKTRTSPYRPESDGMVERFNRTLKDMAAKLIKPCGSDWDDQLAFITFAYNTSQHSVTGFTPFFLTHGREARLPVDELFNTKHEVSRIDSYVDNKLRQLRVAYARVRENIDRATSDMTEARAEVTREVAYVPGQKVWIKDHTASAGGKRKLALHYKGPATVVKRQGSGEEGITYSVSMPGGKEFKVHHNHLKPVKIREPDSVDQSVLHRTERNLPETGGHQHDEMDIVTNSGGSLPSFIWSPNGSVTEKTTSSGYMTRYGRVSRPPMRYPAQ